MTRRVLITGAARRIGAVMARRLAAEGWHVLLHYHASEADAEAVAAEIREAGGACDTVWADLSDRGEIERLIPECVARFGALDALINNASTFRNDGIGTITWESYDYHLEPSLAAPVFLSRDFARVMGERRGGVIVHMLDQKVGNLNPDFFSNTLAKLALAGSVTMMAMAFGGHIRVCGVSPGITLISGKQTAEGFDRAWRAAPLGRSSSPEDLAQAVLFILETESFNGQVLTVDGGEHLRGRARDVAFDVSAEGHAADTGRG